MECSPPTYAIILAPLATGRPTVIRKAGLLLFAFAIGAVPGAAQTISFFQNFTTPAIDRATAVAADGSGVYVFGNKYDGRGGGTAGLRKYDSRGAELWTRELDSMFIARATADTIGVYVLATSGAGPEGSLRKYDPDGIELWSRPLEFGARALAADSTGVYVSGGNYTTASLRKYSPDGAELWTSRFGEIQTAAGVAVDSTGVYALVMYSNGAAGLLVRKWDALGNPLWSRGLNPSDLTTSNLGMFARAYPSGFYLAGTDAWGTGSFLRQYDSDGVERWSRKLNLFAGSYIAADSTGVYLAGPTPVSYAPYRPLTVLPGQCRSGSGGDSFVRKFGSNGDEVWSRQFGTADTARAAALAVDSGGVYLVGVEGTAEARDDFEHFDAFAPANPTRSAFVMKLEKAASPATATPRIFPDCVVNAASYVGGGVAPGEIVNIFGSLLGPPELASLQINGNRLATTLAETRVLFGGIASPLLFVSANQTSAIVPFAIAGREKVDVQVEYKGVRSEPVSVPVLPSRPGIFSLNASGEGQAAILNEDGTVNSPSNPARRGSVITLYATGGGESAAGVEDGQIIGEIVPRTRLPVSVFFDLTTNEFQVPSKAAEVLYSGGAPGSVAGLLQINIRVPANAVAKGDSVPFLLIIGPHWTVYQVGVSLQ
jgi:uncharacterized protein (TIGR03437 family)